MPDPLIDAITKWVKAAPPEVRDLIAHKTADPTQPKQAKADVNYGPSDSDTESCETCAHFDGSGGCAVVAGRINPSYVSDLYTPADSGASSDTSGPDSADTSSDQRSGDNPPD